VEIERSFHRLLVGANRSNLNALEGEFEVKVHVPPFDTDSADDKKLNEIVIVGDRNQVLRCDDRLKQIYEDLQLSTRTLSINVPKKQHRLIIGPKGSILQEIFKKSGCVVEIPASDESSDAIVIRGPENMLSSGLQLVLENANSMYLGEFDIATVCNVPNPPNFAKFVALKEKPRIATIESSHKCTIYRIANSAVFEFQCKSQVDFKQAKTDFAKLIQEKSRNYTVSEVEVPVELHRYLLGKGGQNVQKLRSKPEMNGRLVDILVPSASEKSEQVLFAVQNQNNVSNNDVIVEEIKAAILAETESIANMVNETIPVRAKYHGRIIGSNGNALKDLLSEFEGSVNIRFPSSEKPLDEITIRGPKEHVPKIIAKLKDLVKEFDRLESLIGYEDTLIVPANFGKRLVGTGGSGKDIVWIVKSIREKYQHDALKLLPSESALKEELQNNNGSLYLNFELAESASGDSIAIKGPKSIIAAAKLIIKERLIQLQNSLDLNINLFEEIPEKAKIRLLELDIETKRGYIRQLIGKDGKGIRKILEDYDVNVHFAKEKEDGESDEIGAVHIHGNKDGVGKVKQFLIQFMTEKILNSFEVSFSVPQQALSQIVGRGGSNMSKMSQKHDVKIDFGVEKDGRVDCFLQGSEEACQTVKELILSIAKDVEDTLDLVIKVPLQLHRLIIGPSGNRIKEVLDSFGSEKVRATFPKGGLNSKDDFNAIVFTANESIHNEIKEKLAECITTLIDSTTYPGIVEPHNAAHSAEVAIFRDDIAFVCGKSFELLVELMKKYNVTPWILKQAPNQMIIRLCGMKTSSKQVELAKNEIMVSMRLI
jgi:transcription antitermination factor NusA-like protein